MKSILQPHKLKLLVPACGAAGLLLRLLLTATGTDDKGLLMPFHPAWIGLLLLSAATAGAILAGTRALRGPGAYRSSFPQSTVTAAGCFLAAVSAVMYVFSLWRSGSIFYAAAGILHAAAAVLAVPAFLLVCLCRHTERRPSFLCHVLICVYFALRTLTLYQHWSFDPQLQDYCFQLFASICLTMTAYQLALFDTGKGSHRTLWAWGLASVYLCCLCIDSGLFYLTGAAWAFTGLSTLRRPRYVRRPAPRTPAED